jgi:hypothetical protein
LMASQSMVEGEPVDGLEGLVKGDPVDG